MTVGDLLKCGAFSELALPHPERAISGVYIGDLLSWVMGRAECDNAWITIMSNINVIAVASLVDTACIILAEGVTVSEDILNTAKEKEVNILTTELTVYETAVKLADMKL